MVQVMEYVRRILDDEWASYAQILDAATSGQGDIPARSTSVAYRDVLTGLRLLDPVRAWSPRSPRTLNRSQPVTGWT